MGWLILYALQCLLACALEGAAYCLASRRGWRRWTWYIVPGLLGGAGLAFAGWLLLRDVSWAAGYSAGENAVTAAARLFICLLPALTALLTLGIARIHKAGVRLLLAVVLIGLLPVSATANDGGSRVHAALLYRITFYHRMDDARPTGYRTDTEIQLLPLLGGTDEA